MDDRPIRESAEQLNELRHEQIPTDVDEVLNLVRGDLEKVRALVDDAHIPGLTTQLDDVAADMLKQIRGIGDAAGAAVSTGASELNALLRPVIHISSTSRADWPTLRNPPEDRMIVVDDTFTYTTGEHGRTITVGADLAKRTPAKRNKRAQQTLRGKLNGDDAGHLISRTLGGIGYELNLVAMEAYEVNRDEYRRLERRWERAVRAGKTIEVTVLVTYTDDGFRPAYFKVEYEIDGETRSTTIMNPPALPKEPSP